MEESAGAKGRQRWQSKATELRKRGSQVRAGRRHQQSWGVSSGIWLLQPHFTDAHQTLQREPRRPWGTLHSSADSSLRLQDRTNILPTRPASPDSVLERSRRAWATVPQTDHYLKGLFILSHKFINQIGHLFLFSLPPRQWGCLRKIRTVLDKINISPALEIAKKNY